jgi:hypothetical protein
MGKKKKPLHIRACNAYPEVIAKYKPSNITRVEARRHRMHILQILHFNDKALQIMFSRMSLQKLNHTEYNKITVTRMHEPT